MHGTTIKKMILCCPEMPCNYNDVYFRKNIMIFKNNFGAIPH
jgi:hypothetical protein